MRRPEAARKLRQMPRRRADPSGALTATGEVEAAPPYSARPGRLPVSRRPGEGRSREGAAGSNAERQRRGRRSRRPSCRSREAHPAEAIPRLRHHLRSPTGKTVTSPTRVLVVTDRTRGHADAARRDTRAGGDRGPVEVRILVPNPAPAEWHPTHPECHERAQDAQRVLDEALPRVAEAAGPRRRGGLDAALPDERRRGDAARGAVRRDHRGDRAARLERWLHIDCLTASHISACR